MIGDDLPPGWKWMKCWACGGHGMTMWGDSEQQECRECSGSGRYCVSPKGRLCAYPGAPFEGSLTAEEMKEMKEMKETT